MTDINVKIVIPRTLNISQLTRILIRVVGLAKKLLRMAERGEEV